MFVNCIRMQGAAQPFAFRHVDFKRSWRYSVPREVLMRRILKVTLAVLALFAVVSAVPAGAVPSESRMALVIGNASYRFGALATAANDAGLIAQTLRAAGF